VQELSGPAGDRTLVAAIISMGKSLGQTVIAEGIETEDQLKLLRLMRCGCIQGFLFSKPVSADDMDALLAKQAENAWVIGGGVGEDRRVASAYA
jgi:EAL domain-containing protein (putative c-di-GMP-specific phosphodiesterase class I)